MTGKQLEKVLSDGIPVHQGIGGTSVKIEIEGIPVFVKKVPVTDLELKPENHRSTANYFNLPMSYQYGIGSLGLGVWRELQAHIMTTDWVLSGDCPNFPIMYHWKVLEGLDKKALSDDDKASLTKDSDYWENIPEIHQRLKETLLATHHLYIFLEYVPNHLHHWLDQQIAQDTTTAINAIHLVEKQIQSTNAFLRSQNFLHMDAHFENILMDGDTLYYSDFGLALSQEFELSEQESQFLQNNRYYDDAGCAINLLHSIVSSLCGKNTFIAQYHKSPLEGVDDQIQDIIQKYMPISLLVEQFYRDIQKDKSTPYPSKKLEILSNGIWPTKKG